MSMYLPNPSVRPTGSEPGEFIEAPARPPVVRTSTEHVAGPHPGLDPQTRLTITRWAHDDIAGLVREHHGDAEGVRAVVHELGDELTFLADHHVTATWA